ncbi:hypothetical protein MKJ04_21135 [Pontibacter sp. E15-1]|uniref:hypothetical protein n=1 Tax=Pontibacter sp. E15-1 TaxID=2919918 RepID=UPI001F4F9081|nr:hypothetical protein [Pontibacter sp. E15-1]MCJ8167359.1 hypothetical protein [Pontibacter sp. E15-1]
MLEYETPKNFRKVINSAAVIQKEGRQRAKKVLPPAKYALNPKRFAAHSCSKGGASGCKPVQEPCQKWRSGSENGIVFVNCIDLKTHAEEKKWIN